ncbi:MAG: hypothetical protein LBD23_07680 [Oscillospiraceae bacterium]|jgi:hypothetical protein|nr:hypothetical protein [Oscillospiraceae bacterium]
MNKFLRKTMGIAILSPLLFMQSTSCLVPPTESEESDIKETLHTSESYTESCPVPPTKSEETDIKDTLRALGFYTDWQLAGIPGGIPHATEIFETVEPGGDINAAIKRAGDAVRDSGGASPDNLRVVQLTEGIFNIQPLLMDQPGVILRGMGNNTILRGNNINSGAIDIGKTGWVRYTNPAVDVVGDVKVNDDKITVLDASEFEAGMILKIDRFADDALASDGGSEWVNGHNQFMRTNQNTVYGPASKGEDRPVSQYIEIERVEQNTLHLSNKINIDFPQTGANGKSLNPQVWDTEAHKYQYIGLEDMKLQMTAGNDDRGPWSWHLPAINIHIASSYCWVKNVESDGTYFDEHGRGFMGRHVELNGFRNHVTGGYFHHSSQMSPGGNGYGIRWHGTDCVIDNNICTFLNKPLLGQTSNGGNVIAYNYVPNATITPWLGGDYPDAATPGNPQVVDSWIETAIDPSHGGYSHSDLFEGNFTANIHTDATSNNGFIVLFRNHSFGRNIGGEGPDGTYYDYSHWTSGSRNAVAIDGPQNEHASIGNVYLTPEIAVISNVWDKPEQSADGIVVYRFGAALSGQYNYTTEKSGGHTDGGRQYAFERFYWACDYNYVDNELLSRESGENWSISPDDLPASLFLSTAPDYFNGYTWPPVNPFGDNDTRISTLPAADRFFELSQ